MLKYWRKQDIVLHTHTHKLTYDGAENAEINVSSFLPHCLIWFDWKSLKQSLLNGGRSGNRELPFPSSFQDFNASHFALLDNPKLIIIRLRLCLFKIQLSGTALAHMINEDNIEDICSIYFNLSFGELLCFNISVGKRNFLSGEDGGGEFIPVISNPLTAQQEKRSFNNTSEVQTLFVPTCIRWT